MINEIRKVLEKERNILAAYLYGSVAKGKARPKSDVDIAVLLKNTSVLKDPYFESQLALKIEKNLKTKRPVEIRVLNGASLRFTNQVIKYGRLICTKNMEFTKKFETAMLDRYLDFRPFLLEYDKIREQRLGITRIPARG